MFATFGRVPYRRNVTNTGHQEPVPASEPDDPPTQPTERGTPPDLSTESDEPRGDRVDGDDREDEEDDEQTTLWPKGTVFGRADKICLALIIGVTIFGLIMMPARPVILTWAPLAIVALTGSRTGMVACGALAATGAAGMPTPLAIALPLIIGIVSIVKFDPIYWWAGRLWGDWFIKAMAGQTKRSQKRAARAEALARKYMVPAIGLTYIPFVPIPAAIIYAVLGASGTTLKKFLAVDLVFAAIAQVIYFTMGWFIGEPAVALLDELAKYSLWLALAIIIFVMGASFRASWVAEKEKAARKAERAAAKAEKSSAPEPPEAN